MDSISLMCPSADANNEKVNGGNVTEQTHLRPVASLTYESGGQQIKLLS